MLILIYLFLFSLATLVSFLKSRNHIHTSTPEDFEMTASEDSEMSASEDSEMSPFEESKFDSDEDSKMMCFCSLPAKLRVSHTDKNPYRLFYNCQKSRSTQCGFFQWADEPDLTGDRHVDELNLVRNECIGLQGQLSESEQQLNNERNAWEREKAELMSKLSAVQTELNEIKERSKIANESDLMPPIDNLCSANDEGDNVIEIHTV